MSGRSFIFDDEECDKDMIPAPLFSGGKKRQNSLAKASVSSSDDAHPSRAVRTPPDVLENGDNQGFHSPKYHDQPLSFRSSRGRQQSRKLYTRTRLQNVKNRNPASHSRKHKIRDAANLSRGHKRLETDNGNLLVETFKSISEDLRDLLKDMGALHSTYFSESLVHDESVVDDDQDWDVISEADENKTSCSLPTIVVTPAPLMSVSDYCKLHNPIPIFDLDLLHVGAVPRERYPCSQDELEDWSKFSRRFHPHPFPRVHSQHLLQVTGDFLFQARCDSLDFCWGRRSGAQLDANFPPCNMPGNLAYEIKKGLDGAQGEDKSCPSSTDGQAWGIHPHELEEFQVDGRTATHEEYLELAAKIASLVGLQGQSGRPKGDSNEGHA